MYVYLFKLLGKHFVNDIIMIRVQVHNTLQRIQYGAGSDQIGIGRLLANRCFNSAFPLHDVSYGVPGVGKYL